MAHDLKKIWAALAASFVAATSLLSAAYDGQSWETGCGPCVAPCSPLVNDGCGGWFVSAEALFWKAHEDGLGYAAEAVTTQNINTPSAIDFEIQNPHFKWDTGFRLGLGYTFPCDCIDFNAYWTHFETSASKTSSLGNPGDSNVLLIPLWTPFDLSNSITPNEINAHWGLRLDVADFELGRAFWIGSCVSFRPFVGVRAVWIDQSYRISSQQSLVSSYENIKMTSDFRAVGLRSGFNSEWNLGCGFSIYGSAAASLLYGKIESKSRDRLFTGSLSLEHQVDNRHGCRFASDAALGLRWKQCLCDDTAILTIQLGWEQHLFFDQNRFERIFSEELATTNPGSGTAVFYVEDVQKYRSDLCVQGVTLGARLDF